LKTSKVTKRNHAKKKSLNNSTKPIFKCLFGLRDEEALRSKKLMVLIVALELDFGDSNFENGEGNKPLGIYKPKLLGKVQK
jgi:hypothetical protein